MARRRVRTLRKLIRFHHGVVVAAALAVGALLCFASLALGIIEYYHGSTAPGAAISRLRQDGEFLERQTRGLLFRRAELVHYSGQGVEIIEEVLIGFPLAATSHRRQIAQWHGSTVIAAPGFIPDPVPRPAPLAQDPPYHQPKYSDSTTLEWRGRSYAIPARLHTGLWINLAIFAATALALYLFIQLVFTLRRDDQVCKACAYDLTGLPPGNRCPECGQETKRTGGASRTTGREGVLEAQEVEVVDRTG